MIPLYLKTPEFAEPSASLSYLVASNGVFLVQKSALFTSITKAQEIAGLLPQETSCRLFFPRIPQGILEQVYGFFQAVYIRWQGEAIVFLYYAPDRHAFRLDVPPQTLFRYRSLSGRWRTEMKVAYEALPRPPGFIKLGDIHSHANLPAYFSGADDDDDLEDGLHVVIGNLHRVQSDVRVSFVTNGARFLLEPEEVLEPFSRPVPPPRQWMRQVTRRTEDLSLGATDHDSRG